MNGVWTRQPGGRPKAGANAGAAAAQPTGCTASTSVMSRDTAHCVAGVVTVFFVVFFNTYLGVRSVEPELVKAVQVMGGDRMHLARFVVLPSVFTWIFAALRTSVSFALTGAVVGEFVGASSGLGYRLNIAAGLLDTKRVYLILLILMVFAVTLVEIAKRVEARLLRWRPSAVLAG